VSARDAILLDLDDTILSSGPPSEIRWSELVARFTSRLPGTDAATLEAALAESRTAFWSEEERSRNGRLDLVSARRTIVRDAFDRLGLAEHETARELADVFTHESEERVAPFEGAIETLQRLRERGHALALVTNGSSQFQRRKLERFELAGFFEVVLIEGELGFGKPDRRVFERALAAVGAEPALAWMVGDNLGADVAGAQGLGIRTVWMDVRRQGLPEDAPARPDHVLERLESFLDLL